MLILCPSHKRLCSRGHPHIRSGSHQYWRHPTTGERLQGDWCRQGPHAVPRRGEVCRGFSKPDLWTLIIVSLYTIQRCVVYERTNESESSRLLDDPMYWFSVYKDGRSSSSFFRRSYWEAHDIESVSMSSTFKKDQFALLQTEVWYVTLWRPKKNQNNVKVLFCSMIPNIRKSFVILKVPRLCPKIKMSMEHWKNDVGRRKGKCLEDNLCHYHFFHCKYHKTKSHLNYTANQFILHGEPSP